MYKLLLPILLAYTLSACSNGTKDKYVAGCMLGAGSNEAEEVCECIYDELEDQFGEEKLAEWATQTTPVNQHDEERFLDATLTSTAQCARKLGLTR